MNNLTTAASDEFWYKDAVFYEVYVRIVVGLLIIVQTVGIDLTTLNVVAGAVGIGVGFGLQNIANNFIAGLIILFERPVKVGDRIEVGNRSHNETFASGAVRST
jgi:small-conductance mechanosensitive channel